MKKSSIVLFLISFNVFAAPVNINQADAETISQALSGIGPKKAEAIVKYRSEHGRFEALKDLENVSGIGEKTLKANEKDIIFTDAAADKGGSNPVGDNVSGKAR